MDHYAFEQVRSNLYSLQTRVHQACMEQVPGTEAYEVSENLLILSTSLIELMRYIQLLDVGRIRDTINREVTRIDNMERTLNEHSASLDDIEQAQAELAETIDLINNK